MNNKLLIIAGFIVFLLLLGFGGYLLLGARNNKQQIPSKEGKIVVEDNTNGLKTSKSLRDLLSLGINQMCTYTDPQTQSMGTVYVAGQKVRGDYSTMVDGSEVLSHMISDSETTYVWNEGEKEGFMMSINDVQQEAEISGEPDDQSSEEKEFDFDKQIDYQCGPWSVESSVFDLPEGVEFVDFNKMIEDGFGLDANSVEDLQNMEETTDKCDTCNSLPSSAKEQCLQALGC